MGDETVLSVVEVSGKLFYLIINNDLSVSVYVSGYLWIVIFILFVVVLGIKMFGSHRIQSFEIDEAELGVGNQKIKLKPNNIDSQIAYKIWVELSTRKIGVPIELERDVVVEVYNSWYNFFQVTRELIKEIPVSKLKRKETKNIVKLSIDVLNNGVRPHLTTWQAKFRRWYENEITDKSKISISPQDIQKEYPEFTQLTNDLKDVNLKLIKYREAMYKLIN